MPLDIPNPLPLGANPSECLGPETRLTAPLLPETRLTAPLLPETRLTAPPPPSTQVKLHYTLEGETQVITTLSANVATLDLIRRGLPGAPEGK